MKKFIIAWSILSILVLSGLFAYSQGYVGPTNVTVTALYEATNKERLANGLSALSLDPKLNQSAQEKCDDMIAKNYWEHDSPDGRKPWDFIGKQTDYASAGENLAESIKRSQSVVDRWMGSTTHRVNILNPNFENVGFAICGSKPYVVQHFIDVL